MKNLILMTLGLALSFSQTTHAQESADNKNIIYKYKEYEVIDLGSLEIKGQIMAPGDITVNERKRQTFNRELLEKKDYDFENIREIENLR